MSAPLHSSVDRAALQKRIAESGVAVTSEEVEAVARSLERIQDAASTLIQSLSFDETIERFVRLLDADDADRAGR